MIQIHQLQYLEAEAAAAAAAAASFKIPIIPWLHSKTILLLTTFKDYNIHSKTTCTFQDYNDIYAVWRSDKKNGESTSSMHADCDDCHWWQGIIVLK